MLPVFNHHITCSVVNPERTFTIDVQCSEHGESHTDATISSQLSDDLPSSFETTATTSGLIVPARSDNEYFLEIEGDTTWFSYRESRTILDGREFINDMTMAVYRSIPKAGV